MGELKWIVDVEEVANAMKLVNETTKCYLKPEDGSLVVVEESMVDLQKQAEEEEWYMLPEIGDIDLAAMQLRFAYTLDMELRGKLISAIQENLDCSSEIEEFDLEEAWEEFRDEQYLHIAERWCEVSGLKLSEIEY